MKAPRNPMYLALGMQQVIPPNEPDVCQAIEWVINDSSYKAPEQIYEKFQALNDFVNDYIPYPPTEEWHFQVVSLLTDRSVQVLKEEFNS